MTPAGQQILPKGRQPLRTEMTRTCRQNDLIRGSCIAMLAMQRIRIMLILGNRYGIQRRTDQSGPDERPQKRLGPIVYGGAAIIITICGSVKFSGNRGAGRSSGALWWRSLGCVGGRHRSTA